MAESLRSDGTWREIPVSELRIEFTISKNDRQASGSAIRVYFLPDLIVRLDTLKNSH
jgi:hypothetical protein